MAKNVHFWYISGQFSPSMVMPHIKTTIWTRAFIWNHLLPKRAKKMATRAFLEAKNGQKRSFLVHFGPIFTEYGHAAHQNDRLDEGFYMEPFWALRKSIRKEKSSRKSIRKKLLQEIHQKKKLRERNLFKLCVGSFTCQ